MRALLAHVCVKFKLRSAKNHCTVFGGSEFENLTDLYCERGDISINSFSCDIFSRA